MSSPALRNVRANSGIAFRARAWQTVDDSGLDTNEELDNSETDITMDADASSILSAGDVIHIEAEDMQVVSVSTVTVTVVRGYAGSSAVTHVTNTDVFLTNTASTVLWFPGQDDPQSTTIRDRSGHRNNGTLKAAGSPAWVRTDKGLTVLDFELSDPSYVSVAHDSSIDFTSSDFSIAVWIKIETLAATAYIFNKSVSNVSGYALVYGADGHLEIVTNQGAANQVSNTAAGALTTGVWIFVVATRAAAVAKIYLDGADATSVSGTHVDPVTNAGTAYWGGFDATQFIYDGVSGLLLLESRAFSAVQVAGMYQQERGLFGV